MDIAYIWAMYNLGIGVVTTVIPGTQVELQTDFLAK